MEKKLRGGWGGGGGRGLRNVILKFLPGIGFHIVINAYDIFF